MRAVCRFESSTRGRVCEYEVFLLFLTTTSAEEVLEVGVCEAGRMLNHRCQCQGNGEKGPGGDPASEPLGTRRSAGWSAIPKQA